MTQVRVIVGGIRRLRLAAGIKVGVMAELLGCTYQQLKNYEGGRTRITEKTIADAAAILGVSVSALFEQEGADATTADN